MEKFKKLSKVEMKNITGGVLLRFECDFHINHPTGPETIEPEEYVSNSPTNAQIAADADCSADPWCSYVDECFQI